MTSILPGSDVELDENGIPVGFNWPDSATGPRTRPGEGTLAEENAQPTEPLIEAVETRNQPILDITGEMAVAPELAPNTAVEYNPLAPPAPDELLSTEGLTGTPTATATTTAAPTQVTAPEAAPPSSYAASVVGLTGDAEAAVGELSAESQMDAPQGTLSEGAQATAQTGTAAQADAKTREVQDGELITAAKESDVGTFEDAVAAQAEVDQKATVKYQLGQLMQEFEGTGLPAYAAPAIRKAMDIMASRGMSQSSLAGDAIMRATLEASIPLAVKDAETHSKYGLANLSNRQAANLMNAQVRAQLKGQELTNEQQSRVLNAARISEVNNMNLNNEQMTALENSKLMQGMELANLTNAQQTALSNAATLAGMDTANLNARLTGAVNNAKAFLQMDMSNLTNDQQSKVMSYQSKVQALLSDSAAVNAERQFNAKNAQQSEQYFAQLGATIDQNNANRTLASDQFNADQGNTMEKFNTQISDLRDRFNAEMRMTIDQSNVTWRRAINTANNTGENQANQINAQNMLGLSTQAQNNLWQLYRDEAAWAYTSVETSKTRAHNMAVAAMNKEAQADQYEQSFNDAWNMELGKLGIGIIGNWLGDD